MNAEQFKRANNNSFYVCIVIFLSGLLITGYDLVSQGSSPAKLALIISAFICDDLLFCDADRRG